MLLEYRVCYIQEFVVIFVPGPTTPGVEVITKLDMAYTVLPATVGLYA
jgi:hypothetical protein